MPSQSSLSKKLAETAGKVLIEAAEFGLDWGGEKLLGSMGWKGFKKILNPVLVALKKKFPALDLGGSGDANSVEVAREAVRYIQQDPEMHNLLIQGFNNLEQGQLEILSSVDRLGKLIEANHEEEIKLLKEMDDKLNNIGKLPKTIEVPDTVDRLYLLSKIRAKRDGREFNQNVSGFVAVMAGFGMFSQIVLEGGMAFVRYETDMANAKWYATQSGQFNDDKGRLCRKLSTDAPVWGEPGKRIVTHAVYHQIQGSWKQSELLEQNEYFEQ